MPALAPLGPRCVSAWSLRLALPLRLTGSLCGGALRAVRPQALKPLVQAILPWHHSGRPPGLPACPLGSKPCRHTLMGLPPGPGQVGCQQKPTRTCRSPWPAPPIAGPTLCRCADPAGEERAVPLDTAPGPDQLTEPPGGGGYVPLVQGPLPGWGTAPILTWTRPASRYRSTKVLSLGTDWLSSRETMEKKARWPGTTSTSRTRADVALISAGGRAVAEWWLQRPGREPAAQWPRALPPHVSRSCCVSSPRVRPALLGAGVGARTSRIEPQQQAGRPEGGATRCEGEVDVAASGGHRADALGPGLGPPQQLCARL